MSFIIDELHILQHGGITTVLSEKGLAIKYFRQLRGSF